jgi:hypothetical protein
LRAVLSSWFRRKSASKQSLDKTLKPGNPALNEFRYLFTQCLLLRELIKAQTKHKTSGRGHRNRSFSTLAAAAANHQRFCAAPKPNRKWSPTPKSDQDQFSSDSRTIQNPTQHQNFLCSYGGDFAKSK